MKKLINSSLAVFMTIMLVVIWTRPSLGTVYNVLKGEESLQSVINQTVAGDTVLVGSGIWNDADIFVPSHPITLAAADTNVYVTDRAFVFVAGSDTSTIIDGFKFNGDYGTAFIFQESGAKLLNIVIRDKDNGGIFVGTRCNIVMSSSLIDSCSGSAIWARGSIYVPWGNVWVRNSIIRNSILGVPSNCYLHLPTIFNEEVVYEVDELGRDITFGSVFCARAGFGSLDIYNSYIINNIAAVILSATFRVGNQLNIDTCFVNLNQCTILGNECSSWDGYSVFLQMDDKSVCNVKNCLFVDNALPAFYGDVYPSGVNITWPYSQDLSGALLVDPLFCDMSSDYSVSSDSPCWPGNNASGEQIGAIDGVCVSLEQEHLPKLTQLSAYPNPFNSTAMISFDLLSAGQTKLEVYDLTGRLVVNLIDAVMSAGSHSLALDAGNLSSGIYFCVLHTRDGVQTQKMLLVK